MKASRFLVVVVVLLHDSIACRAQDVEKGAVLHGPAVARQQQKYAVIVGIDYDTPSGGDASRFAPPLKNAQKDATDVFTLLKNNYQYTDDRVEYLVGENATTERLLDVLAAIERNEWTKTKDLITNEDSLLVFFSGHGFKTGAAGATMSLLPADVSFDGDAPAGSRQVELSQLCAKMRSCSAKHKLLILDCCYSGTVFELDDLSAELPSPRPRHVSGVTPRLPDKWPHPAFSAPSFQAIAASHSVQTASDGSARNSPFTKSLLDALNALPIEKGLRPFPVSSLFGSLERLFITNAPEGSPQTPQCRWMTADTGEFFFFPEGDFERSEELDWRLQQQLMAMTPGVNGGWWFDEAPWMMPSVRAGILKHIEQGRSSSLSPVDVDLLRTAGERYLSVAAYVEQGATPRAEPPADSSVAMSAMRLRHLAEILDAGNYDLSTVLEGIRLELQSAEVAAADKNGVLEAVDLHFLAVLQHGLGFANTKEERSAVDGLYRRAIEKYKHENSLSTKPLLTLCYSDYSHFLESSDDTVAKALPAIRSAAGQFSSAGIPASIRVNLLCREGDILMKNGMWGAASAKWDEAYTMAKEKAAALPPELVAWAVSRKAWGCLDQWKVSDASDLFAEAIDVLAEAQDNRRIDDNWLLLEAHARHGRAITLRYQGKKDEAIAEYGEVLQSLWSFREDHADSSSIGESSRSFADTQAKVTERIVNSLERRGDCELFGESGRLEAAEDNYRLALREVSRLPRTRALRWRHKLLEKRALSLALPSQIQDVELSCALLEEAARLRRQEVATVDLDSLSYTASASEVLGELCRHVLSVQQNANRADENQLSFRDALYEVCRKGIATGTLSRDYLEGLLLSVRKLLELRPVEEMSRSRAQHLDDIELLGSLCRVVRRSEESDGVRAFLRVYYDTALNALVALQPKNVRGVVELVHEALAEVPNVVTKEWASEPKICVYTTPKCCLLVLEVPGLVGNLYSVTSEDASVLAREASRNDGPRLPLPREFARDWVGLPVGVRVALRQAISEGSAVRKQSVQAIAVWRDPVRHVGVEPVALVETTRRVRGPGDGALIDDRRIDPDTGNLSVRQRSGKFPFDLGDAD